jgi:ABC-type nitrate/sulfonate/bicarbonate transport system permease component
MTWRRTGYAIWLAPALFWLSILLAWEICAQAGWISRLFFPPPSSILGTLARMIVTGKLWVDLSYTLARLTLGLILGSGLGVLLGWWMGWSRAANTLLGPAVAAIHPLPKLALLPLVLIVFGIGESSKIVLIALTAFFPMLINSMAGVLQIDELTWQVARHYHAHGWLLLRRVILPGSLPMVVPGAQLALNTALMVTVAVELISAQQGLGAVIWLAWQTLRTAEMYAILIVIAGLGLISNYALAIVVRRLMPWRRRDSHDVRPAI